MRHLLKIGRNRAGTASVELVFLAPVIITLLFGLYEGTQAVLAYMKLINACQTVADLVTQQKTIASSDIDDFVTGGQLVMSPLSTGSLGFAIASVTFDPNSGTASVAWQDTRNSTAMTNAAALAQNYGTKGESVIVVTATYTYTSWLHYVLPGTLSMSQVAYSRPRLVASIPHS
ncbi:MAG TPA: TadE/TadG family type IV pilus assembly protein [Stellaceae bacterium]|nr:TadE/TadG family type IV pilus assembly protein [Stellaceae bacterium]